LLFEVWHQAFVKDREKDRSPVKEKCQALQQRLSRPDVARGYEAAALLKGESSFGRREYLFIAILLAIAYKGFLEQVLSECPYTTCDL
jgi:hypothetical protein